MVKSKSKKAKEKGEFSLKQQYKKSWDFLKQTKNYIWFISVLFFVFIIIGFLFTIFFKEKIILLLNRVCFTPSSFSRRNLYFMAFTSSWNF
jgi:hypothetical protein